MRRLVFFCITMIAMAGCTAGQQRVTSRPSPTFVLPMMVPTTTLVMTTMPSPATPFSPSLETSTGPFVNATELLDGVCFEFLLTLNGQSWAWTSPADLSAFYARVDASELCPGPVARQTFDFSQGVLVGTVNVAVGCDAAHRVIDRVQDDTARTQTLLIQLDVLPGCPYELVQPLLVVVSPPPDGYTIQIAVTTP
jgi:hypothetical protein